MSRQVNIHVSDAEYPKLEAMAARQGLKPGGLVRKWTLLRLQDGQPAPTPQAEPAK